MNQSWLESLLEACINVGSGFILSMLVTEYIVIPVWHLDWTMQDNITVTGIYTGIAIVRGLLWRRFFNAGVHKTIHRFMQAVGK